MKSLLMVWFLSGDSMKEQWKEIENYEDYVISDRGRVFSYKSKKFLKPQNDGRGYFQVNLCKNGVRKNQKIHRLVALAFIPNHENKRTINHIDGIKTNNFAENLEWCSQKENVQHSFDTGLQKPLKGSKVGNSKLSESQVLEIRWLYQTSEYTQVALGKIFGISNAHICDIINRKKWTHI